MMGRFTRKFVDSERGAAAVEFAIIVPVLIVLAFGLVEVGRMLSDHHTAVKAVRDGARFATRIPFDCATGLYDDPDPADGWSAEDMIRNVVVYGTPSPTDQTQPLVAGWDASIAEVVTQPLTAPLSDGSVAGLYEGQACIPQVEITANFTFDGMFGAYLGFGAVVMAVDHRQIVFGD